MNKFPFSLSSLSFVQPLDLIYFDVWRCTQVQSFDEFYYYVIFIDHFFIYVELFPIKKMRLNKFLSNSRLLLRNFLTNKFFSLFTQLRWILKLKSFCQKHGISHFLTASHTPEQNGFADRRHYHIKETGITVLTQANLPPVFWTYAFKTIVYLIDRMPTPTFNMSTSFQKIFNKSIPIWERLDVYVFHGLNLTIIIN